MPMSLIRPPKSAFLLPKSVPRPQLGVSHRLLLKLHLMLDSSSSNSYHLFYYQLDILSQQLVLKSYNGNSNFYSIIFLQQNAQWAS